MIEFDDGINKITDWQKIRLQIRQGDWQIPSSHEQYLVHWKPSAIEKWALQYHIKVACW
jgi:hypothetical protein